MRIFVPLFVAGIISFLMYYDFENNETNENRITIFDHLYEESTPIENDNILEDINSLTDLENKISNDMCKRRESLEHIIYDIITYGRSRIIIEEIDGVSYNLNLANIDYSKNCSKKLKKAIDYILERHFNPEYSFKGGNLEYKGVIYFHHSFEKMSSKPEQVKLNLGDVENGYYYVVKLKMNNGELILKFTTKENANKFIKDFIKNTGFKK